LHNYQYVLQKQSQICHLDNENNRENTGSPQPMKELWNKIHFKMFFFPVHRMDICPECLHKQTHENSQSALNHGIFRLGDGTG